MSHGWYQRSRRREGDRRRSRDKTGVGGEQATISELEGRVGDSPRADAYFYALRSLKKVIKNKTALDLSRSQGLYASFAIESGASQCYVLEPDGNKLSGTEGFLKENGYQLKANVFTQLNQISKLLRENKKVDIIIHDWEPTDLSIVNDYFLDLVEAKEKFLSSDGLILPDDLSFLMVCIEDHDLRLKRFAQLDALPKDMDFSYLRDMYHSEMHNICNRPHAVVTKPFLLKRVDFYSLTSSLVQKSKIPLMLEMVRRSSIDAIVIFYVADFTMSPHPEAWFSNDLQPQAGERVVSQNLLWLDDYHVRLRRGQKITGTISLETHLYKNQRSIRNVRIQAELITKNREQHSENEESKWKVWYRQYKATPTKLKLS